MRHPRDILLSLQANARKSLSQNFLTSPHWADRLTQLVTEVEADEYWEIGPGLGALTTRLRERTKKPVRVFEFDRKLAQYLRETLKDVDIVEGDFLKAALSSISPQAKRVAVLSNLPYHLSSPILFKLIEDKARFPRLVLTFQKEFADRLCAQPGDEAYAALSVLVQLHFHVDSIGIIPPGAFYPAPGVSSEALLMRPRQLAKLDAVANVVKAAFRHRRKKVISNLKEAFPKAVFEPVLASLNIGTNARPEEISKEQYVKLAEAVPSPA